MELLFTLTTYFPLIMGTLVLVLLIYLVIQRGKEKEKENFEDRDN